MTIHFEKVRIGDEVSLRRLKVLRFREDHLNSFYPFELEGVGWVDRVLLSAHHPAPLRLAKGDMVHAKGDPHHIATVRGVDGDQAWLQWPDDWPADDVFNVSDLTLAEGDNERA